MFRDRKPTRTEEAVVAAPLKADQVTADIDSAAEATDANSPDDSLQQEPWWTPEIAEAVRERRRALQRYRRQASEENLIAMKQTRAKVRRLIQQSKQDCIERGVPVIRGRGRGAFRGSGGVGPWPTKGRRFVDSPYNNSKKLQILKAQKAATVPEDASAYRQKMMITPDPVRKYAENEVDQIKEALLEALEPLEDGYFPQFYGLSYSKGALIMSCANEQTKLWLERIVPELKPWEGAKLRVKPKGEVTQGPKVQIKTPKLFAKSDSKKVLQMLSTQNKTLDTSNWKSVSVTSEDSGQTLVYVVDKQSVEAIQALNNKVYLGLGNVEVVIFNEEEEEEDGKQASEDTEMENEASDKQMSADTDVKSEEGDKKTSVDTEMKNEEEGDKQTSTDADMKNENEVDKKTS